MLGAEPARRQCLLLPLPRFSPGSTADRGRHHLIIIPTRPMRKPRHGERRKLLRGSRCPWARVPWHSGAREGRRPVREASRGLGRGLLHAAAEVGPGTSIPVGASGLSRGQEEQGLLGEV